MKSWKNSIGLGSNTCVMSLIQLLGIYTDRLPGQNWKPPPTASATPPASTASSGHALAQSSSLSLPSSPSSPMRGTSGQTPIQMQAPSVTQFNMLAAAAAARNFGHQVQFQPMRFDVGTLNAAAAAGHFTSPDMNSFGSSSQGSDAGASPGGGWNRR